MRFRRCPGADFRAAPETAISGLLAQSERVMGVGKWTIIGRFKAADRQVIRQT
jgi:hypothetical protein